VGVGSGMVVGRVVMVGKREGARWQCHHCW